jgi:hypothetical protein
MTYIPDLHLFNVEYITNDIQTALQANQPIEEKLHMIICISNPCNYKRRYLLAKEFITRMSRHSNVILYIVELCYSNQKFAVTEPECPRHLQLRTESCPIWAKETLWNMGVKHLLPSNWKAVAFCDADIEFDNPHFALDTLKVLNGTRDVVQMFSHCLDLDINLDAMNIFASFGYQYTMKRDYKMNGSGFWHTGYTIAMTRAAYQQMGKVYETGILGAGDFHFFLSIIQKGIFSANKDTTDGYKQSILNFQGKCHNLKLGYVPGVIRHYFHGSKKNRRYTERWKILIDHRFDPFKHIDYSFEGLMIPSKDCPQGLLDDIMLYFSQRNEDEFFI